jgi:hypothetical protein
MRMNDQGKERRKGGWLDEARLCAGVVMDLGSEGEGRMISCVSRHDMLRVVLPPGMGNWVSLFYLWMV